MSAVRSCAFVGCLVLAAATLEAGPVNEFKDPLHTQFHDTSVTIDGTLILPSAGSDGQPGDGEYRVQRFDSDDGYILALRDDQKVWAQECGTEPVKVVGVYKDGGVIEVTKLCHWYLDDVSWQMVCECNRYRQAHRLAPLQPARDLLRSAFTHSWNMRNRYGFRHGGTSGWSAENIAMGQPDAVSVTQNWYTSSGHRANMLNPGYRYIGVGYYNGMWTQQFR
ncbi:MAG TPA: CAP domain-containing protein [Pirellulales bacterium]|nr:CAP domain-containing protein [Pirellulales bacterium]